MPRMSPRFRQLQDLVQDVDGLAARRAIRLPSAAGTSRSPFPGWGRRPAPCRRAPAPGCRCKRWRAFRRETSAALKTRWRGSRQPRLMPNSGSPSAAAHAVDQLDAGPDAAGILPAAAGAAQPFAQDGARGHQAAVLFVQAAGERADLAGGAHADARSGRPAGWWRRPGAIPWECRSPC